MYSRMRTIIQPMCIVVAYFISDRPIIGPRSVSLLIRSFPTYDKEKGGTLQKRAFCTPRKGDERI